MAVFLDANIFLYAAGADSPHRRPCIAVLRAVAEGRLDGVTNSEVVQEILHVISRRLGHERAVEAAVHCMGLVHQVLAVDSGDMHAACQLLRQFPHLPVRDAVHAACAARAQIRCVVSVDRHFDGLPSLTRVDPTDTAAVAELLRA